MYSLLTYYLWLSYLIYYYYFILFSVTLPDVSCLVNKDFQQL